MTVYQAEVQIHARSQFTITADFLARLRRGRPPYAREPIIAVVKEALDGGVDASLSDCRDRVRSLLELKGILAPGDTVLEGICKPEYQRALSAKNSDLS
jgi:hypothetical protein